MRDVTDLLNIANKFKTGELKQEQRVFYHKNECGTAGCLAGWDYVLNSNLDTDVFSHKGYVLDEQKFLNLTGCRSPWEWSRDKNNLTLTEAELMFCEDSNISIQITTLEQIQAGKTIETACYDGEDFTIFDYNILCRNNRTFEAMEKFFKGTEIGVYERDE